jgi:hypothetical protein
MSRKGGETWGTQHCRPERIGRFAKRSGHGVEGPHARKPLQERFREFSPGTSTASRERLSELISLHTGMGSFDCVIVRKANDNFAQDDNLLELSWLYW